MKDRYKHVFCRNNFLLLPDISRSLTLVQGEEEISVSNMHTLLIC